MDRKELCKQLAAATEQMESLLATAEKEGRAITDEEQKAYSELDGTAKDLEKQIADLDAAAKRREDLARRKAILGAPAPRLTASGQPASQLTTPKSIPRVLHRYGKLRGFSGEHALQEAHDCGQWILAHLYHRESALSWLEAYRPDMLAMASNDNAKGGFLVPDPMERAIIDLREQYGVFRREAKVWPMAADTDVIPRRTGGLTAYFVGDNTEITASDKGWDQVKLTARKIGALALYSSELAEDAIISIADDLAGEIAYAFASKEDDCGFLGTGTSTYGGIVGLITACTTATATTVTAASGNTSFDTLDMTDFENMVGKLPQYAEANAKWYIHKAAYAASMMRLIDAAGGNTLAHLEAGPTGREFLGYPVVISQKMNSTLTTQASTYGLCYFGDLRQAASLGDRRGIRTAVSTERYFEYDQIGIKGTERFDIVVHDVGDTSNAGSLIMLATPAS